MFFNLYSFNFLYLNFNCSEVNLKMDRNNPRRREICNSIIEKQHDKHIKNFGHLFITGDNMQYKSTNNPPNKRLVSACISSSSIYDLIIKLHIYICCNQLL